MQIMQKKMLFILGRGRSGTTLLSSILNNYEQICVAPECMFIMNLVKKYKNKRFNGNIIDQFCKDIFLENRIKNWSFNKDELVKFLKNELAHNDGFSKAVKAVYFAHAVFNSKSSSKILGDKNPHYALFPNALYKLFPNAYWIHIVRDPRAVTSSYKRVNFDYSKAGILAVRWNKYNNSIINSDVYKSNKYIQIKYEDLISSSEDTVKKLLDFLKISKVERQKPKIVIRDNLKSCPWHQKLQEGLDNSRINAWKRELKIGDIELIEKICYDLMVTFSYLQPETVIKHRSTFFVLSNSVIANLSILLEKILFNFPVRIRSKIIKIYRRMSKTL